MAFLAPLTPLFMGLTAATAVGGLALAIKGQSLAKKTARQQAAAVTSLAPPPLTGPTVSEAETLKAKEAADKRAADIQAGIKADTLAAQGRRSLTGLAATIRTSARGLTGTTATEKKTLLGEGGLR